MKWLDFFTSYTKEEIVKKLSKILINNYWKDRVYQTSYQDIDYAMDQEKDIWEEESINLAVENIAEHIVNEISDYTHQEMIMFLTWYFRWLDRGPLLDKNTNDKDTKAPGG